MNEQLVQQPYLVNIYDLDEPNGGLTFTFSPKVQQHARGRNGAPQRVSQFSVTVRQLAGELSFDWSETPDEPGDAREEIQSEIETRMNIRATWIDRVTALVAQVEQWAKELGWATRRIEKKLDDSWIGQHRVPALLLQEETCRIILEPLGRSSSGSDGVADLYLMPAYDDIASLYYKGNQWHINFQFASTKPGATLSEAVSMPLSKEALEKVLTEMKQHAD